MIEVKFGELVTTITLRHSKLDAGTLSAIGDTLRDLAESDAVPTVVILRASGPDFSLGRQPSGEAPTPSGLQREFGLIQEVNELVQTAPFVTVAAVHGRAVGAGLSLAGRCDLVVASATARFSFPEIPHGVPPTIVLSHYRYVLPQKALLDLILTGREIDAAEALRVGLVSRVVPDEDFDPAVAELAASVAAYDPRTIRTVKSFLRLSRGLDPRDAPALGIQMYANEMVDRSLTERAEI